MKIKKLQKLSILFIAFAMLLGVALNLQAEEVIDNTFEEENIEFDEDAFEGLGGLTINPNHETSSFEDIQIGNPENVGGPMDEASRAYPAGGPYVGHLSGKGTGGTVYVYPTSSGGSRITYIEDGYSSGVFPILDEVGGRYKIALSGVVGWVDKSLVTRTKFNPDTIAHDYYIKDNGELIHNVTSNPVKLWYTPLTQGVAPSYIKDGTQYMSWDGHYFYPATVAGFNNLIADYNAGNRNNSINKNDPFYNYFQWLPARTQTILDENIFEQYLLSAGFNTMRLSRLRQTGKLFMDNGNYFGGNAALGFAMAVHESGWGGIAGFSPNRNNFFGHNAYDSAPGMASRYPTPNYGIGIHFGSFWNWNYLNSTEYVNNGGSVGDKGTGMNVQYASDPYWGEKIAAHYYNMDKLAPANKKDYKRYTLGTIDASDVNLRKDAYTSSGVVYKTKNTKNTIAIIEEKTGTNVSGNSKWYGFTSEPILTSNKDRYPYDANGAMGEVPVNIAGSTIYIHSSYVTIVSQGSNSKIVDQPKVTREKTPTISTKELNLYALGSAELKVDTTNTRDTILTVPKDAVIKGYKTDDGFVQVLYDTRENNPYIAGSTIHYLGYIHQSKVSTSKNGKPLDGGTVDPDPKPDPLPQPGNTSRYVVPDVGLYMRTKPVSGDTIILVPKGAEVKTGPPLNGWVHATYNGKSGYMSVDFLTTTKPTDPGTGYKVGDVNGDGKVTSVDYMMIKNYIMGRGSLTAEQQKRADVDGDGKITSRDYMMVKNIIMGR